jgi:outer membrane lipoprotein-sorting protein
MKHINKKRVVQTMLWEPGTRFHRCLVISACLLLLVMSPGCIVSQDFKQALLEIRQQYESATAYSIRMNVVITGLEDNAALLNQQATVNREGDNYAYRFDENEFLMNPRVIITIDHAEKLMLCQRIEANAEPVLGMAPQGYFSMDSILVFYDDPQYLGVVDKADHFRVRQKSGLVTEVDMYIDRTEKALKRLEYIFDEDKRVSIDFIEMNFHPSFSEDTFDEKKYIIKRKNETIVPTPAFKGYRLEYTSKGQEQ